MNVFDKPLILTSFTGILIQFFDFCFPIWTMLQATSLLLPVMWLTSHAFTLRVECPPIFLENTDKIEGDAARRVSRMWYSKLK